MMSSIADIDTTARSVDSSAQAEESPRFQSHTRSANQLPPKLLPQDEPAHDSSRERPDIENCNGFGNRHELE